MGVPDTRIWGLGGGHLQDGVPKGVQNGPFPGPNLVYICDGLGRRDRKDPEPLRGSEGHNAVLGYLYRLVL